MKLRYYIDAGHGWVAAKRSLVKRFNLDISHCSYQRGDMVYLEEDCDAPKLMEALLKSGIVPELKECYSNHSRIRSYEFYR